jgi:hypothetical protein
LASSTAVALVVFIFQLPAINGVRVDDAMILLSSQRSGSGSVGEERQYAKQASYREGAKTRSETALPILLRVFAVKIGL